MHLTGRLQTKPTRGSTPTPGSTIKLIPSSILKCELINFAARKSTNDDEGSISWRENEHDDLVFALMLACYYFERMTSRRMSIVGAAVR